MYSIDKKRIFWKKVDEELVILDIETGIYYTLNEVGARIWELALDARSIKEIVDDLLVHFDASEDVMYKDAEKVLRDLVRENILLEKKGA